MQLFAMGKSMNERETGSLINRFLYEKDGGRTFLSYHSMLKITHEMNS